MHGGLHQAHGDPAEPGYAATVQLAVSCQVLLFVTPHKADVHACRVKAGPGHLPSLDAA